MPHVNEKLKYITKNTLKSDKIQAASTPLTNPPKYLYKSIITTPTRKNVGRPKTNFKPALNPLRKVGFDRKIRKYSSQTASQSPSNFGMKSMTKVEEIDLSSSSSSEINYEAKIQAKKIKSQANDRSNITSKLNSVDQNETFLDTARNDLESKSSFLENIKNHSRRNDPK